MGRALTVAAVAEIATGAALLFAPALVGELLLGAEVAGLAATVARVAGIALIGLGLACWPGPPGLGMLAYGIAATLLLAWFGITGAATGLLLWPAVALHAALSALIVWQWEGRSRH